MPVTVLVVDDSGFFRRRIGELLQSDSRVKVIGMATNGREAIDKVKSLSPDVVTMDYEMPMMDGITAVKHIMQEKPTPVLMFSSLTHEGARVTLDALDAGAIDYLPKSFEDISRNSDTLRRVLADKIVEVSNGRVRGKAPTAPTPSPAPPPPASGARSRPGATAPARPTAQQPAAPSPRASAKKTPRQKYSLVAIGTSTGGPVALQKVLTKLPAHFPAPIVLIQHMPATFTEAFAERLNKLCSIKVVQAQDGDSLRPGIAYLAPGGKQMMIERGGRIRILPGDERLNYKPCVDVTFGSAAKSFGEKVLAVVLTGMGADGREGARMLKRAGSKIWSQDEASCVIYGMPMAIERAQLSDEVIGLEDIGPRLVEGVG